jgi:hypothetical protein
MSETSLEPTTAEPEREPAVAAVAAAATSREPAPALLLRLQRTAGNRAAGALLARQDDYGTGPSTLLDTPSNDAEMLSDPYDRNVNRWVTLDSPSVSLNAPNVSKMDLTRNPVIPWDMDAESMLTKNVQKDDKHLVFNCHGFQSLPNFGAPHLSIGTVVHAGNVGAFTKIAGTVKVIWISACNIAGSTAGSDFMAAMAKNAGAYVVAPTMAVTQNTHKDAVEDTAGAMWLYYDPTGTKIARSAFIGLGPSLGFTYQKKFK